MLYTASLFLCDFYPSLIPILNLRKSPSKTRFMGENNARKIFKTLSPLSTNGRSSNFLNTWYVSDTVLAHLFVCLFAYLWLSWVFVAARGLSPVVASGGYTSLQCAGCSLRSTGSKHAGFSSCGSWAVEHRLSSCGARA